MTEGADHLRLLEAILFASAAPVSEAELARFLPEEADVSAVVAQLAEHYRNRGVNLVQVGKAWAFRSASDLAPLMRREQEVQRKLSRAAIETLSVIAYHQPVTRAEIEEIRGVSLSKGTLDVLLEAGWIRPRGRRRTPGKPVTWGTSQAFLDHFGLARLDDLPGLDELAAAGLLDKRPALTALSSRGTLTELSEAQDIAPLAEDQDEDEEDSDPDSLADALEADFGDLEAAEAEGGDEGAEEVAEEGEAAEEVEEDTPEAGRLRQVEA